MIFETSTEQAEFKQRIGQAATVKPPSRLVSMLEARKQWADAGRDLVTRAERKRRYSICKQCDSFVKWQCKECKCFMRLKTLLAGMTCRLDKW